MNQSKTLVGIAFIFHATKSSCHFFLPGIMTSHLMKRLWKVVWNHINLRFVSFRNHITTGHWRESSQSLILIFFFVGMFFLHVFTILLLKLLTFFSYLKRMFFIRLVNRIITAHPLLIFPCRRINQLSFKHC